jgi:hypothetical protein
MIIIRLVFLIYPCDINKAAPTKVPGHAQLWGGRQKGYGNKSCHHIESVCFPTKFNQQHSPYHLATIYPVKITSDSKIHESAITIISKIMNIFLLCVGSHGRKLLPR